VPSAIDAVSPSVAHAWGHDVAGSGAAVAEPDEPVVERLHRRPREPMGADGFGAMPATPAQIADRAGVDQEAQFVHEMLPEQCTDQRPATVYAH
jgi:hypothetical protein